MRETLPVLMKISQKTTIFAQKEDAAKNQRNYFQSGKIQRVEYYYGYLHPRSGASDLHHQWCSQREEQNGAGTTPGYVTGGVGSISSG